MLTECENIESDNENKILKHIKNRLKTQQQKYHLRKVKRERQRGYRLKQSHEQNSFCIKKKDRNSKNLKRQQQQIDIIQYIEYNNEFLNI